VNGDKINQNSLKW